MVPDFQRLETWLVPSWTTRSRRYHKSTIVWRNLPLYHLFTCLLSFVTLFVVEKTRQSTRSGGTGAGFVRPRFIREFVWTGSFRRGRARFRGDQKSRTTNGALLTPSYLLALLRELSQCPRALTWVTVPEHFRKTNVWHIFCTNWKKRVGKLILTFRT